MFALVVGVCALVLPFTNGRTKVYADSYVPSGTFVGGYFDLPTCFEWTTGNGYQGYAHGGEELADVSSSFYDIYADYFSNIQDDYDDYLSFTNRYRLNFESNYQPGQYGQDVWSDSFDLTLDFKLSDMFANYGLSGNDVYAGRYGDSIYWLDWYDTQVLSSTYTFTDIDCSNVNGNNQFVGTRVQYLDMSDKPLFGCIGNRMFDKMGNLFRFTDTSLTNPVGTASSPYFVETPYITFTLRNYESQDVGGDYYSGIYTFLYNEDMTLESEFLADNISGVRFYNNFTMPLDFTTAIRLENLFSTQTMPYNVQEVYDYCLPGQYDNGYNFVDYFTKDGCHFVMMFRLHNNGGYYENMYQGLRTYYFYDGSMLDEETQQAYNTGYNAGKGYGQNIGYEQGYSAGDSAGYTRGYNVGDSAGFTRGVASANDYSFIGLIGSTIDAPIRALTGLLNFEILGVNLSGFVYGLFTISLVIMIIKYIKGGK